MRDLLAAWWQHPVVIERRTTEGPYGPGYATPTTTAGYVSERVRMVRDETGEEVVSSATIALPAGTEWIPPGSRVTLPESFGGRTATVLSCQTGDAGAMPTPNHMTITLE